MLIVILLYVSLAMTFRVIRSRDVQLSWINVIEVRDNLHLPHYASPIGKISWAPSSEHLGLAARNPLLQRRSTLVGIQKPPEIW